MKQRIVLALLTLVLAAALVAGGAMATAPTGLGSVLLGRGTATEFKLKDKSQKLKLETKTAVDVAVVEATLQEGGSTGWHTHPGPSLVVVKTGTLAMDEPGGSGCGSQTFGPGQAFVHPEDVHNFRNAGSGELKFYVIYLVPQGAAPLADFTPPAPEGC